MAQLIKKIETIAYQNFDNELLSPSLNQEIDDSFLQTSFIKVKRRIVYQLLLKNVVNKRLKILLIILIFFVVIFGIGLALLILSEYSQILLLAILVTATISFLGLLFRNLKTFFRCFRQYRSSKFVLTRNDSLKKPASIFQRFKKVKYLANIFYSGEIYRIASKSYLIDKFIVITSPKIEICTPQEILETITLKEEIIAEEHASIYSYKTYYKTDYLHQNKDGTADKRYKYNPSTHYYQVLLLSFWGLKINVFDESEWQFLKNFFNVEVNNHAFIDYDILKKVHSNTNEFCKLLQMKAIKNKQIDDLLEFEIDSKQYLLYDDNRNKMRLRKIKTIIRRIK